MLFNSFAFAVFLPIVFALYWLLQNKSYRVQNILLLVASYYFYGCWDWRFLFLLAFSTALDFFTGLKIYDAQSQKWRKAWLLISVIVNLSFLGFFKYYNFFAESFAELLGNFGMQVHVSTLNIILPVGISFYTFHGLSYVFDIYNRKIIPTRNVVDYTLFVSFFPLLVAAANDTVASVDDPKLAEAVNAALANIGKASGIVVDFAKAKLVDPSNPDIRYARREPIEESPELDQSLTDRARARFSPWLDAFGPGYIDMAFHAARAANPNTKLVYNDWGCEQGPNDRFRATTLKLLDGLLARRVPIDALGLQGHLEAFGPRVDQRKLRDFLNEIRARGLSILVTELDVLDTGGPSDIAARDRGVADEARRFLDVVLDNPATNAVLTWSLSDRHIDPPDEWKLKLMGWRLRKLPYDAQMHRKPLWTAIAQAFAARRVSY